MKTEHKHMPLQNRNQQIRREAKASLLLYLMFFLWWYLTGYGIAEQGSPKEYISVLGLPLWFFLSSVMGYLLFCIASCFVVKYIFKDFSLESEEG